MVLPSSSAQVTFPRPFCSSPFRTFLSERFSPRSCYGKETFPVRGGTSFLSFSSWNDPDRPPGRIRVFRDVAAELPLGFRFSNASIVFPAPSSSEDESPSPVRKSRFLSAAFPNFFSDPFSVPLQKEEKTLFFPYHGGVFFQRPRCRAPPPLSRSPSGRET